MKRHLTKLDNELLQCECELLTKLIIIGQKQEAANTLDELITRYGCRYFLDLRVDMKAEVSFQASLLCFAALYDNELVVSKLLDYGASTDDGTSCKTDSSYDNHSPLMAACESNSIKIVEMLLSNNADLLHVSGDGVSVLMIVQSLKMFHLILSAAKQQNCLNKLLSLKDCRGNFAHQYVATLDDDKVLEALIYAEYRLLRAFVKNRDEDNLLWVLDRLFMDGNYWGNLLQFIIYLDESSDWSILDRFVVLGFERAILRCIAHGLSFNEKELQRINQGRNINPPLALACLCNQVKIVKIILKNGADLLFTNERGESILMACRSQETCRIILNEAKERGVIKQLLSIQDENKIDIFQYACDTGNIEVLTELMQVDNYHELANSSKFLSHARSAFWHYPEKSKAFNDICLALREKTSQKHKIIELSTNSARPKIGGAYNSLFGRPSSSASNDRVKVVISQFYALLEDPHQCVKYLRFINQELVRYFQEKHNKKFPRLNPDTYEFRIIDGTYYPVPKESYVKLEKCHALQEYLMALFNKYDLAKRAYKWIGFIPHKVANKMISKGDMVTESRLGTGLFHNKLAHMLQRALLIYAIENGDIQLNGIAIRDVFKGLVTLKCYKSDQKIWMAVRDTRNFSVVSFTDPHRLGSVIMHDGKDLGIDALSDSLIDTFCNGLMHLLKAYQKYNYFEPLKLNNFIDFISDLPTAKFDSPLFILEDSIELEIIKGSISRGEVENLDYACIPKHYDVDKDFELGQFKM